MIILWFTLSPLHGLGYLPSPTPILNTAARLIFQSLIEPPNPCPKIYMLLIASKANFLRAPRSHPCPLPCLAGALPTARILQALLPYCAGFWCLLRPAQTQHCSHLLQRIFWRSTEALLTTPHSALFNSCFQVFTHSLLISCWIICSPYRFNG